MASKPPLRRAPRAPDKADRLDAPTREPLGLREKNKRDKLRRIKDAAFQLFVTKGFDETTTREIAEAAGVGMGTVFVYAQNKRDLLFLIANDDLEAALLQSGQAIRPGRSLLDMLSDVFRHHYDYFSRQPALSRLMLREMTFYDSGTQAARFKDVRERLFGLICDVVQSARAHQLITSRRPKQHIAWVLFCVYQVELRQWISEPEPEVARGMADLRKSLALCLEGVGTVRPRGAVDGKN